MVKRFQKGKMYTLCLAQETYDDIYTWCANVQYKGRIGSVLEFHGEENTYSVDIENKIVTITYYEIIQYFNHDTSQYEYDELEKMDIVSLTNIVAGWQY